MRSYIKKIVFLLGKDKNKLPLFFLLFIILSFLDVVGIGLIGPYISIVTDVQKSKEFIDTLNVFFNSGFKQASSIYIASVIILLIFLIKTIFAIFINKKIISFGASQQIRLRTFLMKSYQSLSYSKYTNRNSSEYLFNIQQLVPQYSQKILIGGIKALCEGMVVLCILIFLLVTNFIAFIMLSFLSCVLLFAYDFLIKKRLIEYGEKANLAGTKTMQSINEGIEGLKEIRILQAESFFYDRVKKQTTKYANFYASSAFFQSIPKYFLELSMIFFIVTFVMISIFSGNGINDLFPILGVLGVASIRLIPSINILSVAASSLRFSKDGISKLYDDYAELVDYSANQNSIVSESLNLDSKFESLSLNDISFGYENISTIALDSINFKINKGESIGLIGPSGSGKTTLVDLILGLYEPSNGEILFNGSLLSQNMKSWRSNVAYLPQQVFLLDSSLKNNIAIGVNNSEIDSDKLLSAIKKACLEDLVKTLPNGIETLIGERGVRLSGGQRQRISIARAFYLNKDVLILDESTSALDSSTEEQIVKEIEEHRGDKTLITIAHRLSTLKYCDRVLSMHEGRIISNKSFEEVMKS
jgi:ABC-type multidrug transport system fused ATPase/permease subunit